MNSELLIAHFNRISDAPDAIPRLRQFILDLAVRGKLIDQDSNDTPVVELLLQNDQARQVISKEDRRADADRQSLWSSARLWNIPTSWRWCALADLLLFIDYRGKTPPKTEKGVRLITAKNVKKGFINYSPEEFVSETGYHAWMTRGFPKQGDILFTTEAPMGNAAVVMQSERFALAQRVICFRPYGAVNPAFLTLQLLAQPFQSILNDTATGLTAKGIKSAKLRHLPVAVPSLAEQRRIVTKVNELMALCDRLEAVRAERENRQARLTAASHHHLNNGADGDTLRKHAHFFVEHLPRLSARPDQIKQLRETILNLAVRGQVVPQENKPTSAHDLIDRVKVERNRRIDSGQIKQVGPLKITGDEKRFDYPIPSCWVFCFVDDVALKVTDGEHATPRRSQTGYYLLSARNVTNNGIDVSDVDFVPEEEYRRIRKRCDPDKGDILISCSGSIGRVAVVDQDNAYTMVRSAALIKLDTSHINSRYLAYVLRAGPAQEQIGIYSKSTAQANLFIGAIRKLRIPLPPLAEQNSIVARVDELMVLCDRLETQLTSVQTDTSRLLEAILYNSLNSSNLAATYAESLTQDLFVPHAERQG